MSPNDLLNKDTSRFALGTVKKLGNGTVELSLTRHYAAAVQTVWAMLTEPDKAQMWWCKIRGTAKTGSPFDMAWLNVKDEDGNVAQAQWWNGKVVEAQEPKLLRFTNSMHGTISFELSAEITGTQLVLTNTISVPDEVANLSLAGWHVHLDHLQEALEGKSVDWTHWWDDFYPGWEKIHASYQNINPIAEGFGL